jgi:pilus assembly protein CpaF
LIALLRHLYGERRVAVLEQVPEIPKISPLWVRLAAQEIDIQGRGGVALEQVFGELLRLRPDVVAIGELRQAEVKALKRALLAGVGPVWSTLHAHGVRALCARLGELSQDAEIFWEKYLTQQKALVLVMQREKPRLREAWRFSDTGLELIFSSTRGTERQGSF